MHLVLFVARETVTVMG